MPAKAQDVKFILEQSLQAISAEQDLNYEYQLLLQYPSEDYHYEQTGKCFVKFSDDEEEIGFIFQYHDEENKVIYNGSECFELSLSDSTSRLSRHPSRADLEHFVFLNLSPVTWKYGLQTLISDSRIVKSLIRKADTEEGIYRIRFEIESQGLGKLGNMKPLRGDVVTEYIVSLNSDTYLPVQIEQRNHSQPDDLIKTNISYYDFNDHEPSEKSWYYSSYSGFSPVKEESLEKLQLDQATPTWKLPLVGNTDSLDLETLQGEVVLLEFWIKNCGYCIEAVETLNQLYTQYHGRNLKIIGVNCGDSVADAEAFIRRNKPNYINVRDEGTLVSKAYGVIGYPQVFLLDRDGTLLYQGSPTDQRLKNILETRL